MQGFDTLSPNGTRLDVLNKAQWGTFDGSPRSAPFVVSPSTSLRTGLSNPISAMPMLITGYDSRQTASIQIPHKRQC
jgi:hypothetical protein